MYEIHKFIELSVVVKGQMNELKGESKNGNSEVQETSYSLLIADSNSVLFNFN